MVRALLLAFLVVIAAESQPSSHKVGRPDDNKAYYSTDSRRYYGGDDNGYHDNYTH